MQETVGYFLCKWNKVCICCKEGLGNKNVLLGELEDYE